MVERSWNMSICCKAIRQIYYNAGSGYTVASYMTNEDLPEEVKKQKNGNYGIFQAFGTELPTNEGLDVELTGDWKPTKYGMQYSVSNFSVTMPTTKEGIRTYLSSSLIKGIGPAMAARIVETFGEDTLNVFNDSPEKLLQVKGITQKRLDDILEGYQKSSSIRELMMYLSPFGVTPAKVSKIQEKFGPAAVMIVKEEPFRLCEVHGFGFLTVDQIAVKAKHFRADDPLRIKAAILHIMSEAEGEGHLYLKREDIIERVEKLLNHNKDVSPVSERAIRDTGNDMIHTDGSLVCHDGGFYTRKSFQAELGAAAALVRLHMQTGMAVNVDRILRKIQKEQDIILNGEDSKISCTKMRLLKKIELRSLLLHGAAYMAKYPNRKWNSHVAKENGTSCNGFCIVRGKDPKAKGQKGDLLLLLKEQPGNSQILEIGVICIDGRKYPEETWIDVTGKLVEL